MRNKGIGHKNIKKNSRYVCGKYMVNSEDGIEFDPYLKNVLFETTVVQLRS
jgi:hypothetical protein